ncbi:hypothetical protein M0R89_10910 [Halorussus limi]|uniref:Uncharacterized protein n=1 Tax=Halorussus limi TaxID=2938695 RepID=A0A8U0HQ28_9EURY|nr:hypothetical protein [Halorussus limi]UPV73060.1 hypothetical protein M0R89_10910 [Halorussus limi]
MKRRDVLASVGVAISTSGCAGLLSTKCEPGADALGPLWDDVDPDRNRDVSIRGVVVKFVDGLMVVHDGTGLAELTPPGWKRFNEDWFQRGDCVAATGLLDGSYSWESGRLRISISSADEIETVGDAEREPPTIPAKPDASFAVDYRPAEGSATMSHTGGESVPARRLAIRRLHGDEVSTYPWHELTEKAPDDEVTVGDSVTFEKDGSSQLVWRYDEHWSRGMSDGWSL